MYKRFHIKDNYLEESEAVLTLVPEDFFCHQERERNDERRHLVAGDVNLTIVL